MIHRVYLGLGSNIEPGWNIAAGLDELAAAFTICAVSGVYRSAAVGFDGDPFLNCVVAIDSRRPIPPLASFLRTVECRYGRTADCAKFSSRRLDIDILTYDTLTGEHFGLSLPRPEITQNAYVLCPFAEIAGNMRLPGGRSTLAQLWSEYDTKSQPLARVAFNWRGRALPFVEGSLPAERVAVS